MTEKKETPNQYERADGLWFGLLTMFLAIVLLLLLTMVIINRDLQAENKQLNAKIVQIQEENEELKKGVIFGWEIDECICVATFEEEGRMFVWNGNTVICATLDRYSIVLPTINAGDIVYIAYRLEDFSDAEVIGVQPK